MLLAVRANRLEAHAEALLPAGAEVRAILGVQLVVDVGDDEARNAGMHDVVRPGIDEMRDSARRLAAE